MGPSKHTSLHVAPRPDLIGLADIAAAALTATVRAFLDHIITEAVCGHEKICTHCVRSSTSFTLCCVWWRACNTEESVVGESDLHVGRVIKNIRIHRTTIIILYYIHPATPEKKN